MRAGRKVKNKLFIATLLLAAIALPAFPQQRTEDALARIERELERFYITDPGARLTSAGKLRWRDRSGKVREQSINWRGVPKTVRACMIRTNGEVSTCIRGGAK